MSTDRVQIRSQIMALCSVELSSRDSDVGYLDFSLHMGYVIGVIGLFCAFTFTLICLILAEIADPSIFQIQVILTLLSLLFYVSLYLLADSLALDLHYCGRLLPLVGSYKAFEYGVFVLFYMFGLVVPLIYFSWSQITIALIAATVYVVFSIMAMQFILRPLLKFRKQQKLK